MDKNFDIIVENFYNIYVLFSWFVIPNNNKLLLTILIGYSLILVNMF
jgi:hypothetical protein